MRPLLQGLGVLFVVGLVVFFLLMITASRWMQLPDQPMKAEAIVVLAGDYSRPLYAADLYQQGYAPMVYVSRSRPTPQYNTLREMGISLKMPWEIYQQILLVRGVSADAIQFLGQENLSTVDEAESSRQRFGQSAVRLLVVTSPFHTRRAKMVFQQALPNADIRVLSTPYEKFPDHSEVLVEISLPKKFSGKLPVIITQHGSTRDGKK